MQSSRYGLNNYKLNRVEIKSTDEIDALKPNDLIAVLDRSDIIYVVDAVDLIITGEVVRNHYVCYMRMGIGTTRNYEQKEVDVDWGIRDWGGYIIDKGKELPEEVRYTAEDKRLILDFQKAKVEEIEQKKEKIF